MGEKRALSSVADVLSAIERIAPRLPVVRVPLGDALGLTLAEGIASDMDYPPFVKAVMDGFAVRAVDCRNPPTTLTIIGEVAAGQVPARPLSSGEAMRINTGAPMPAGADAVVIIEHVQISADGRHMTTPDTPAAMANVAPRAADVRTGDVVLEAGARLGSAQIAAAAAAGAAEVRVYRRPRLAVLVTGDELVPINTPAADLRGGQIRDSNRPTLVALAREAGCDVIDLGVVGDRKDELAAKVRQGLDADVLCVSGGMSMGQHDYVPGVLADAGVRIEVQKIAIKPGKPTAIGVGPAGQMVFGLPGNPVSTFVCFLIFVRAALAGMQGRAVGLPPTFPAVLDAPLKQAGPRMEFVPARLSPRSFSPSQWTGWRAMPTRWTGSGDVFGLGRANGFLVREVNAHAAQVGEIVSVMVVDL